MVSGDISLSTSGTVTEVVGDKIYAFGHFLLGYGRIDLPMATGKVHTVVSNMASSFKLTSVDETVGAEVKAAVETARPALESEDIDHIKAATEELEKSSHKLAEALYAKAQAEQGAAGGPEGPAANGASADAAAGGDDGSAGSGDNDNVVDADFEEVKPS